MKFKDAAATYGPLDSGLEQAIRTATISRHDSRVTEWGLVTPSDRENLALQVHACMRKLRRLSCNIING